MEDLALPVQALPPEAVTQVLIAAAAAYPLIALSAVVGLPAFFAWLIYRYKIRKLDYTLISSTESRDILLKVKKLEHETERMKSKKPVKKD